jgi:hypothetical protein
MPIYRIASYIKVLMQGFRNKLLSALRIAAKESARRGVVVSGAEVIEA